MLFIGLCGTIGAGKGSVADYLVDKYGFKVITMGNIIRAACKEEGLEPNRENCQRLQEERIESNGEDYWTKRVIGAIRKNNWEKVIFDGVRYPHDVEIPKKEFKDKYKVILVDADKRIRFERLKKRHRIGDPKAYKDFLEQERREEEFFNLDKTIKMGDYVVYNNVNLESLYKKIDAVMSKLKVDKKNN